MRDSGPGPDAGPDGGGGCEQPAAAGTIGGRCRMGTTCGTGLTCYTELSRIPMTGAPLTLENAFEILTAAAEDPAHEGEYLIADDLPPDDPRRMVPAVPIAAAPGGQCTEGCNPDAMTDPCGECAFCSETLGGAASFGAVGIGVRAFDVASVTTATNTGICRQKCLFDPATNGDCPMGYTCDASENICVEACTSDTQCNLNWGLNRHEGLVAVVEQPGSYTCNMTTGRCDWTAPTGAAVGAACEGQSDCPEDIGQCFLGGRCGTFQCNQADPTDPTGMTPLFPCPTGSICIGFAGGNEVAACLQGCNSPTDCPAETACSPLTGTVGGFTGICWGICDNDAQCHADERCRFGVLSSADAGICSPFCTPAGQTPMTGAVTCEADQLCVPGVNAMGMPTPAVGYCQDLNGICFNDEGCEGDQACEILGDDLYGRCVDGCAADTDCDTGDACVFQRYCVDMEGDVVGACTATGTCEAGQTCRAAETRGVCRTPGDPCSPSPRNQQMRPIQPLRGDLQCAPTQSCSTTVAEMLGTCVDCGAAGERCCANNVCDTGATCNTTSGLCM